MFYINADGSVWRQTPKELNWDVSKYFVVSDELAFHFNSLKEHTACNWTRVTLYIYCFLIVRVDYYPYILT